MWDLLLSESKYFLELANKSFIGYFLLIGTILFLKSSFDACNEMANETSVFPVIASISGTIPDVLNVILLLDKE